MQRRGKYQGVRQILAFNRGFYLAALAMLALLIAFHQAALAAVAAAWTVVSLVVSHYVYDRSALYALDWLHVRPTVWLNVHAGFDETTSLLSEHFGASEHRVFDVFDPRQMTEPSIARAREVSPSPQSEQVSWSKLPAEPQTFDAVFVIFAAHEFRRKEARDIFFSELARVLKRGGVLVVVEHLRDLPNFLAYGPGCLHFQSRRTWLSAFRAAQLTIRGEYSITPFVRVFEVTHA